ncbi:putative chromatin-remodeling factor family [Senna tora]|uniref:Putative chromatin-remodeling factor family n=1 Tax=Senna tora TaxID=362788 RepID=A0A835CHJ4_9FABA|nr:putative chromatin-remodeling factor family [Senna tora]
MNGIRLFCPVLRAVKFLGNPDERYTIEEKVIERAYKKLALDALVIQQGRLAEQKNFGAEMVFGSKDSTITDEDIDRIIAKGEETTVELDAKMKKSTEDAIKFIELVYIYMNYCCYIVKVSVKDMFWMLNVDLVIMDMFWMLNFNYILNTNEIILVE